MVLPSELQRAQVLTDRLNSALRLAKNFKRSKASLDIADVEELIQLLADSIRTAKEFDLVEFDGTIRPTPRIPPRIESGGGD